MWIMVRLRAGGEGCGERLRNECRLLSVCESDGAVKLGSFTQRRKLVLTVLHSCTDTSQLSLFKHFAPLPIFLRRLDDKADAQLCGVSQERILGNFAAAYAYSHWQETVPMHQVQPGIQSAR